MSMALFFQAFTADELQAMERAPYLINIWVRQDERCVFSTDIGNSWDILNRLLAGAGMSGGKFVSNALSNGCELLSPEVVRAHAERLAAWTPDKLLEALRNLDPGEELYHLDVYKSEEEEGPELLLDEFTRLVDFYRHAAERGLGVIHYAA